MWTLGNIVNFGMFGFSSVGSSIMGETLIPTDEELAIRNFQLSVGQPFAVYT